MLHGVCWLYLEADIVYATVYIYISFFLFAYTYINIIFVYLHIYIYICVFHICADMMCYVRAIIASPFLQGLPWFTCCML